MFHPLNWEVVEVRPRQASVLACVVLTGTSEVLVGSRFLRELVVGVTTPSDLMRSIIVKIFHSVEGEDVEQVCSNLKIILLCLRLLISLTCIYILHAIIVCIFYMLDISLCYIDIYEKHLEGG